MTERLYEDDSEPFELFPAGRTLYVPVRPGPVGCTVRMFRTPRGGRTAVGFSTEERLTAALGPLQPWIRLGEPALRSLAEPLDDASLTIDPKLVIGGAAPAMPERRGNIPRPRDARAMSALRAVGAAALVGTLSTWIG